MQYSKENSKMIGIEQITPKNTDKIRGMISYFTYKNALYSYT